MTGTTDDGGLLIVEHVPGAERVGPDRAVLIRLNQRGEAVLTVGRLPLNDVLLSHPTVSRRHAEVRINRESGADVPWAEVTDLGGTVGTYVQHRALVSVGGDPALGDPSRGNWRRLAPHQPTRLGGTPCQIGPFLLSYQPAYPDVANWSPADDPVPRGEAVVPRAVPARRAVDPAPAPRVAEPASRPAHTAQSRYLRDLPTIFHDDGAGDLLNRMLLIYEGMWEPLEQRQDHIAAYFDPRTCPTVMLPWLAAWFGVRLQPQWSEGHCRRLLVDAVELLRWRGTRYALVRLVELSTDVTPEIVDDRNRCTIRVRLPRGARANQREADALKREVELLVRANKPAHVGYIIEEV